LSVHDSIHNTSQKTQRGSSRAGGAAPSMVLRQSRSTDGVELFNSSLSSEGATHYESFLRRKPLWDYTPDRMFCQLVFDLLTRLRVHFPGQQPFPDRSFYTTLRKCNRMHTSPARNDAPAARLVRIEQVQGHGFWSVV